MEEFELLRNGTFVLSCEVVKSILNNLKTIMKRKELLNNYKIESESGFKVNISDNENKTRICLYEDICSTMTVGVEYYDEKSNGFIRGTLNTSPLKDELEELHREIIDVRNIMLKHVEKGKQLILVEAIDSFFDILKER